MSHNSAKSQNHITSPCMSSHHIIIPEMQIVMIRMMSCHVMSCHVMSCTIIVIFRCINDVESRGGDTLEIDGPDRKYPMMGAVLVKCLN